MKKMFAIALLLFCSSQLFSQFDFYATAALLKINDKSIFYNNTSPGNEQSIGAINFQNANLGTFPQNSGALRVIGAEVKTFKSAGNDVCGAILFFTVYKQGQRPAGPVYTSIGLGFYADCNQGACTDKWGFFDAQKGGGCCNAGDQKWQYPAGGNGGGNNGDIDITGFEPGNYTLEMYYQIKGSDNGNTGCNDSRYDNNSSAPANYTASFAISTPLPVRFGTVDAISFKTGNQIAWSTLSEQNTRLFEIERSLNGVDFTTAGTVGAKGNSSRLVSYTYFDPFVSEATTYYRVKMIEYSGRKQYSAVVKATPGKAAQVSISPNPAHDFVLITGAAPGSNARILSAAGTTLRRAVLTDNNQKISLQNLPAGTYLVQISNSRGVQTFPVIIAK